MGKTGRALVVGSAVVAGALRCGSGDSVPGGVGFEETEAGRDATVAVPPEAGQDAASPPGLGAGGDAGLGVGAGLSLINCGKPGTDPSSTHWVSTAGAATWASCGGATALADSAACSLATANQNAAAGDTVYLRGGDYATGISPAHSGTADAGLTFKGYGGEAVRISGMARAIDFANRSFVTVDGVAADTVSYWLHVDASDHICIFNCVFTNLKGNATPNWPDGLIIANSSKYNWVKSCSAGGIGYAMPSGSPSAIGGMFLGDWEIANDMSSFNLIENNTFYHGGHHVLEINSPYNIIRDNYFHNENWTGTCSHPETNGLCGDRNIIIEDNTGVDAVRNVIENNVIALSGVPADGTTSTGMSVRTQSNIVRHNRFYFNDGPGLSFYTGSGQAYNADHGRVYHNVFYHNGFTAVSMTGSDVRYHSGVLFENSGGTSGVPIQDVSIKNNLFFGNNLNSLCLYYTASSAQTMLGNYYQTAADLGTSGNLAITLPPGNIQSSLDPLWVNASGPLDVANPTAFDFHLKAGSPAVDTGVFLTKTTSAGSGTVIAVEDAGYFIDGYGIVPGDRIQFEGQTQTVGITAVDYTTNRLTVEQAVTWVAGQGVSLPYSGSAPDIGAHER
jgi:hypothetical protein